MRTLFDVRYASAGNGVGNLRSGREARKGLGGTVREGRRYLRQRPNNKQRQKQKQCNRPRDISSLLQFLRIVSRISIRDIAILSLIVKKTDRTEGFPVVVCVLEDGDADRYDCCGANSGDAAVETGIGCPDRCDCYFAGEALGEGELDGG